MKARYPLLFILLLAVTSHTTQATDLTKENRWAEQIIDAIVVGEPIWLKTGQHEFLGIYTEAATNKTRGGVILMHGLGAHPNWNDIIYPLRTELPEYGWATLSIQLPVLPNEAESSQYAPLFDEVAPRIKAARAYLKAQDIDRIVIAAHSLGASMAGYYLSTEQDPGINAYIGIGMSGFQANAMMNNVELLKQIRLPVLDLYGGDDLSAVVRSSKQRQKSAALAGNKSYQQHRVHGANHFFDGKNIELIKVVSGWLEQLN